MRLIEEPIYFDDNKERYDNNKLEFIDTDLLSSNNIPPFN